MTMVRALVMMIVIAVGMGGPVRAAADHVKGGRAVHRIVVQVNEDNPQLWNLLERLDSLKKFAGSSVGYTVCSNTMKAMQVEGQDIVELVDDFYPGIVRVVELHEKGYVYLRP
jgi:intracellular sulfur oxidation DsrE/DsrF family protein